MRRRLAAAVFLVFVTGCAAHTQRLSASDKLFVSQIAPHHELGMTLIDEATLHSSDVRLRRLVFEMSGYHTAELEKLHSLSAHDHIESATDFPGLIGAADINRLASLDGSGHDTWWLRLMIIHHEGALDISRAALAANASRVISSMARDIETVQQREISDMRELLSELCSENSALPGC